MTEGLYVVEKGCVFFEVRCLEGSIFEKEKYSFAYPSSKNSRRNSWLNVVPMNHKNISNGIGKNVSMNENFGFSKLYFVFISVFALNNLRTIFSKKSVIFSKIDFRFRERAFPFRHRQILV